MNVLIASASTGAGHVRAAEAIEAAFKREHAGVTATHVNVLDLVAKPFRKIYEDGYVFLADRAPAMWGWLYETTDKKGNHSGTQRAINAFQRNCAKPFLNLIDKTKPDLIISTHFMIPQILSSGVTFPSVPVETVITDYDLHRIWLNPLVRRYYVGNPAMVEKFDRLGIDPGRVHVSGIPIHPIFSEMVSRQVVQWKFALDANVPTLLFLSGGLGFGALEQRVKKLFPLGQRMQIITVAGKNNAMLDRLRALRPPSNIKLLNLGYVTNMHELLSAADLVVTKAGGLTTAECLAKGAPMLIMSALPGQERKNAEFLLSKEAGVQAENPEQMSEMIRSLLQNPGRLFKMASNARAAGKPRAAFTIAGAALAARSLAA